VVLQLSRAKGLPSGWSGEALSIHGLASCQAVPVLGTRGHTSQGTDGGCGPESEHINWV
jgi:hypothetical protein